MSVMLLGLPVPEEYKRVNIQLCIACKIVHAIQVHGVVPSTVNLVSDAYAVSDGCGKPGLAQKHQPVISAEHYCMRVDVF